MARDFSRLTPMPERRPKTQDEIDVLLQLQALGDELLEHERRFVHGTTIKRAITNDEALGIANLLARYAARPKER